VRPSARWSSCLILLELCVACDHPILVSKDFQKDADALDSKPAGKSQQDDDDDGGLADLLQKMGVNEAIKRCDVCRTEYVVVCFGPSSKLSHIRPGLTMPMCLAQRSGAKIVTFKLPLKNVVNQAVWVRASLLHRLKSARYWSS
jgi:hypothetical protein